RRSSSLLYSIFKNTAHTEIYTLSLHDALPILEQVQRVWSRSRAALSAFAPYCVRRPVGSPVTIPTLGPSRDEVKYVREDAGDGRSEEHTSELQSRGHLVCRLLLEKKKQSNAQE